MCTTYKDCCLWVLNFLYFLSIEGSFGMCILRFPAETYGQVKYLSIKRERVSLALFVASEKAHVTVVLAGTHLWLCDIV